MIRISVVSYLNAIPFVYGIMQSGLLPDVELSLDMPSKCATKLKEGKADIGLVPSIALNEMPDADVISDYCIGSSGRVLTVALLSDVPIGQIKKIYLDYQSLTSVELLKILAQKHWKINPEWCNSCPGYEDNIAGTTAGLVIGDRVFGLMNKHIYQYDLSEEWHKMTGMPFVFACWVSVKKMQDEFLKRFEKALAFGIANKEKAIQSFAHQIESNEPMFYLENYIHFHLDEEKMAGLNHFLLLSNEMNKSIKTNLKHTVV